MQFQVPQFIEVEDKIFGPLTFKQFVYVMGGLGSSYLLWRILPLYAAIPLIALSLGFSGTLAFLQFNGRPFIIALEHGFFYFIKAKLYLWSNAAKPVAKRAVRDEEERLSASSEIHIPKLSDSKLHELAWSLDIKERIAAGVAGEDERAGQSEREFDIVAPIRTAREARI